MLFLHSWFSRLGDFYRINKQTALARATHALLQLAALLCLGVAAIAQQPYSLIHYDENVLPQTSIGNIVQDTDGYLWMSTQFGIVRFDGERFRVFTTDNLKGLVSNRIRLCAKGTDQRVYFVDEHNTIIKVISPNQFQTVALSDAIKESKPLYSSESNSDFAYLPFGDKLNHEQLAQSMALDPSKEPLKFYAISRNEGYVFYIDHQKKTRIYYYNGNAFTTSVPSEPFQTKHTFKLNNRVFRQLDATTVQWFKEADLRVTIPVVGLPARYNQTFNEDAFVLFSNETGAFYYSSGNLYQYEFRNGSDVANLVFEGLPCTAVVDVMKERNTGDFMISTKSNGFYRIKKKQFGVVNLRESGKSSQDVKNNFNSNIVYGLAMWDKDNIFCSGYITPVAATGSSSYFLPEIKPDFSYYFLHPRDKDHIWVIFDASIQRVEKTTRTYSTIAKIADPRTAIDLSSGVSVVVAAHSITLLDDSHSTALLKDDSRLLTTAEKISDDSILVGSRSGISYFHVAQARLDPVPYPEKLNIRSIFKDRAGRIWFTTYGQGLFCLTGRKIIPIPLDNAGYLGIGHNMFEDNSGSMWVSTNHGLFKLNYHSLLQIISGKSNKLFYTYFDKTDGFNTNEFNGGCYPSGAYQKETGQLFLPSMDGIVKFNPDSIRSVNSSGLIYLDEIIQNDTGKLNRVTDNMVFSNETATLRLNFSSPYYGHVENIKFSYELSNDARHWIELERNRSISLSNLPGGNYTLVIKKEDAVNAPILTTFRFEIEKKFTETVVFKLLLLAGVIALVYLYFMARLTYLGRERTRLEKEVVARTADQLNLIEQLKDNIYQLKQLQFEKEQMIDHKENVIAILIHDIKSPLYFLNTVASHLDRGITTNAPDRNKKIANEISTSLNRLYRFTQDFAIWLELSRPGYIQHGERVNIDDPIQDALTIYKEIIEKKDIIVSQTMSPAFAFGDAPMIKSVIRNLIDNAVKNTAGAHLFIATRNIAESQTCEIIIADEGKGMLAEDIVAINNYFQSRNDEQIFSAPGFGHKVIRDFLSKLGGDIVYTANTPSGVAVTLRLPATRRDDSTGEHHFAASSMI